VSRRQILILAVACEGGIAALAWLLGWLFDQPSFATLSWSGHDLMMAIGISLPPLIIALAFMAAPRPPLMRLRRFYRDVVRPLFASCGWLDLLLISALAGFGEELLFRGVFQAKLCEALGSKLGLIAASALFGLAHPITPAYVVLAGLMGAYLGASWIIFGNLLVPIVAHAVYDFVMLIAIVKLGFAEEPTTPVDQPPM
jgi:membrane protease YdiL (CAAX protease family)